MKWLNLAILRGVLSSIKITVDLSAAGLTARIFVRVFCFVAQWLCGVQNITIKDSK